MTIHTKPRGLLFAPQANAAGVFAELREAVEGLRTNQAAQITEIRRDMDAVAAQMAAFRLNGGGSDAQMPQGHAPAEHAIFAAVARNGSVGVEQVLSGFGDQVSAQYRAAMTTQSDPNGGYYVLPATSGQLTQRLFDQSPIARLARVETITAGDSFEEVDDRDESEARWVGEEEARPKTATPKLGKWSIPLQEIYSMQPVTQRLLDDSGRDVGAWLVGKIVDKFARSEGPAYVSGDGIKKPRGFLSYDTSELGDFERPRGAIQFFKSGDAAGFPTSNPGDVLRDLVWGLRAPYRAEAVWLMNSETASRIDKFKNENGDYIWRYGMTAGAPPSLLGYPVEIDENMPAIGANALPIAFANLKRAYCIVDRPGFQLLRDPYTDKPNVNFYAYRRVGGGMTLDDAIKLLKITS